LSSALTYYDGYRRERLPANLIQAERDLFGAHTFERLDKPGVFHFQWTPAKAQGKRGPRARMSPATEGIDVRDLGSTTCKRQDLGYGLGPDACFDVPNESPASRPERRWGLARLAGEVGGTVLRRILVPPPLDALIIDSFHLSQWSNVGINYTLGANVFCKGATRGQKACMKML
jgi:6-phosphogluconate dehydrogenase, C-terminal domain